MNGAEIEEYDSGDTWPQPEYSWQTPINVNSFQSAVPTFTGEGPRLTGRGKQILRVKEQDYYFNNGRRLAKELREVLGTGMSNYDIERHWGQFDDAESKAESDITDSMSSLSMATCSSSFSTSSQSSLPPEKVPVTFKDLDRPLEENPLQKLKLALEKFAKSNSKPEPPPETEEPKVRNVVVASMSKKGKMKFRPLDLNQDLPQPSRPSMPRPVFTYGLKDSPLKLDNQNFPPL